MWIFNETLYLILNEFSLNAFGLINNNKNGITSYCTRNRIYVVLSHKLYRKSIDLLMFGFFSTLYYFNLYQNPIGRWRWPFCCSEHTWRNHVENWQRIFGQFCASWCFLKSASPNGWRIGKWRFGYQITNWFRFTGTRFISTIHIIIRRNRRCMCKKWVHKTIEPNGKRTNISAYYPNTLI